MIIHLWRDGGVVAHGHLDTANRNVVRFLEQMAQIGDSVYAVTEDGSWWETWERSDRAPGRCWRRGRSAP